MPSETPPRRSVLTAAAALGVLVLVLHSGVARHEFTLDSRRFLGDDARVEQLDVGAIFGSDYWNFEADPGRQQGRAGLYRPLSLLWLSVWLNIGGTDDLRSGVSSSVNWSCLLLHVGATLFRFLLFLHLLGGRRKALLWAFLAALATGVHPVASEVVGTQVGAAEGLAGLFSAAALWLLVARRSPLGSLGVVLCTLCALLSKENAAALAPVAPLLLWWAEGRGLKRSVLDSWPVFAGAAAWFLLRGLVLGFRVGVDDPFFAGFSGGERVATAFAALWSYDLPALLLPLRLLPVVTFEDVEPQAGFGSFPVIAGAFLFLLAPLAALVLRKRAPKAAWGLLSAWLFFLPVANVLLSIGALCATRFLYLPLLGLGAALALGLARLWEEGSVGRAVAGALLVWFIGVQGILAVGELGVWKSNATLFEAAFERAPGNSWAAFSAGNVRREKGDGAGALAAWEAAVSAPLPKLPSLPGVPENILDVRYQAAMNGGLACWQKQQKGEAQRWFEQALGFAEQGREQAGVLRATTNWSLFSARALESLAGLSIEEAAARPVTNSPAELRARDLLEQAESRDPGGLTIALTRTRLPLCRGDVAGFRAALKTLYQASRERIPESSDALRIAQTWAQTLEGMGRKEEAIAVKLKGAMAGERWIADAASWLNLGLEGSRSQRRATRKLARSALEKYLERDARDPRGESMARQALLEMR